MNRKTVKFYWNDGAFDHFPGTRDHPENPARIKTLLNWANQHQDTCEITKISEPCPKETLRLVHADSLIESVALSERQTTWFTPDTGTSPATYKAALTAVQAGVITIENASSTQLSFALVRPPGHHANQRQVRGFCYFNNIAVAAAHYLERNPQSKIAIIDIDHHYGDGTAEIFYNRPDVLYVSYHADPMYAYPGTGYINDIGEDEGKGYNVCLPLPPRAGPADYAMATEKVVTPLINEFEPDIILVSVGFDAFERDPIGMLGLTPLGFQYLGQEIKKMSDGLRRPVACYLEGGYAIDMLPTLLESFLTAWIKKKKDERLVIPESPKKQTTRTIESVVKLLEPYWNLK